MNIDELALKMVDTMLEAGFQPQTAWNHYVGSYAPIAQIHKQLGFNEFNQEAMTEFDRRIEKRYMNDEISREHYKRFKRNAERMSQLHYTGKIEWSERATKNRLTGYYETLLNEVLSQEGMDKKSFTQTWGYARRFFSWLLQEGHHDLGTVSPEVLQRYFIVHSKKLSGRSLRTIKSHLKKLYRYLTDNGYIPDSYERLFSFPVAAIRKILPAARPDELSAVLASVDLSTPKGKRDYAMILLGIVTGLRAIDVARLKLGDIDWRNGEIKIIQEKTMRPLALPLTKDIGKAIQDYILNGRPKIDTDTIFLTSCMPIRAFSNGKAVLSVYMRYRKKADIPYEKGQGFHALRRAAGLNMVTGGVPVTTVAQVLGHANIDSTKPYISLDCTHLKECALGLTGIEPNGGAN